MQTTTRFEMRRKATHIVTVILLVLLLWYVPQSRIVMTQLLILGIVLSLLQKRFFLPGITPILELFEREDEKKFPGKALIMMVAGALLAELFFGAYLAIIGLLVLAFADSAAHIIGKRFGRTEVPWDRSRHIEGRIAGAIISFIILTTTLTLPIISLAIISILIMLVESLPMKKIGLDDNLVIPVITAVLIYSFA